MPLKSNTEIFIKRAKEIHGDKYDYSKVNYVNNRTPVCIICPVHGEFLQTPHEHLDGCGCAICSKEKNALKQRLSNDVFISRAKSIHGEKYNYSKTNYVKSGDKVVISCPKHGDFLIRPENHLKGQGCPLCAKEKLGSYRKSSTEKFIEKSKIVHGEKYDYSKVDYKGNKIPVIIICPEHGEFLQRPNDHLMGRGCKECGKKFSIKEKFVLKALKERYNVVSYQYKEKFLQSRTSYKTIDFYLPDYKIGVEYQGAQHFFPNKRFGGEEQYIIQHQRDLDKFKVCEKNGIKMFYISFESKIPKDYFAKVYTSLEDLFSAIDGYIEKTRQTNKIINEIVLSVLNEIKK